MMLKRSLVALAAPLLLSACGDNAIENSAVAEPATLLYHRADGIAPGFEVPGLLNCGPNEAMSQIRRTSTMTMAQLSKWHDRHLPLEGYQDMERQELLVISRTMFFSLPDADWSEGSAGTSEDEDKRWAATKLAQQHNQAAFRADPKRIQRLCPDARLNER